MRARWGPAGGERPAKGKTIVVAVALPELGESVVEGTVSQWLVGEGDRVDVDQPLVEVTTDKVDAEIPSPVAGVVQQILIPEGQTVPVGETLVIVDPSATSGRSETSAPPPSKEPSAPPSKEPSAPPPEAAPIAAPPPTPVARRVAEEASVDLDAVQGTGGAGA